MERQKQLYMVTQFFEHRKQFFCIQIKKKKKKTNGIKM